MSLKTVQNIIFLIQRLGLNWFLYRATYEFQRRTGLLKWRFPSNSWEAWTNQLKRGIPTLPEAYLAYRQQVPSRRFFFSAVTQAQYRDSILRLEGINHQKLLSEVGKIESGVLKYFERKEGAIGFPPQWNRNPFNGRCVSNRHHWVDIPDFAEVGDIKVIWEASRFAVAYKLVRAYWLTGDESHADLFWALVENWKSNNLPQLGPNWKCGQEAALRVMAWCFALYGFANSIHSTPQRLQMLIAMIGVHATRIEANIGYALSQKNNHSISEAVGIYTVGLLFPELKRAAQWRRLGKDLLIKEGMRQIYSDGAYVQQSMNYHRLMFHNYLWGLRLGQLNNDPFPEHFLNRLRESLRFLYQMVDPQSGRVPNYGPNDGALILPLNNCDYLDYRPVLQAMSVLLNGERLFTQGAWDEDLFWLFGIESFQTPRELKQLENSAFENGGYYTFRGRKSWGMIRCHTYQDRPHQADMLHFDLWYNGHNLFRDTGSFHYYCDPPWVNYFKSTAAHNTVEIDSKDQMEKGGHFLWFNWIASKSRHNQQLPQVDGDYWEGEHYGYRVGKNTVIHRRAIIRLGDRWVIVDDILGIGEHSVTLRWHLANLDWEVSNRDVFIAKDLGVVIHVQSFSTPQASVEFLCGTETSPPEGWESLYYSERQPIPVIKCHLPVSSLPVRFVTTLHFDDTIWTLTPSRISVVDEKWYCQLSPPEIGAQHVAIIKSHP